MTKDGNDFFMGYIEEVQTYIPIIKKGIEDLQSVTDKGEIFDEVYRLVHIIRGASAMVGINGLCEIAACMETALDKIREGQLALSYEAFFAMQETVECFDHYCRGLRQGTPIDEKSLLTRVTDAFAKVGPGSGEALIPAEESILFAGEKIPLTGLLDSSPDKELLDEFRAEAEEHLKEIQHSMQFLGARVTSKVEVSDELREVVRKIRRSVHTIKGASAVIGLHDLSAFSHLVEDVLDWLYESATDLDHHLVELLTEALDLLAAMIFSPASFEEQRAEKVLAQLHVCMRKLEGETEEIGSERADWVSKEAMGNGRPIVAVQERVPDKGKGSLQGSLFSEEEQQLLREGFQEEAEEHLQALHQAMQVLETQIDAEVALTPEHREEIRKIRRAVHTIKGASAVIGINEISSYAHGVEDFLDWLYEGAQQSDPAMINILAESLDLLGLLVEAPQSVNPDRQAAMHHRLLRYSQSEIIEARLDEDMDADISAPDLQPLMERTAAAEESDDLERQSTQPETAKTIRINQPQLDLLINLTNELLVGVSGFDQNMGLFKNALDELELTSRRLKDIALELETKFEVKALDRLTRHFAHLDRSIADIKVNQSFTEFDAMELDRYTQLNLIIRSMNESTIDVSAIHTNLRGIFSGIGGDISRQHRVIRELQVQMMRTRMSPMSTLTPRLSRTMRDVASRLGKRVRLRVEGERVDLDRVVWEKLADPFMHLIRNAIHHGIEREEERLARNKPEIATITLTGSREGNHIVLRFSDDGRGLDFGAIREKARQFGLGTRADQMDEQDLTDLIFYPGFSTKTISEISGRGVGMDVVKQNVHDLQGTISVETSEGEGTTFVIRVPLTLGVVRALMVRIGEDTYGIALNDIKDIHRADSRDLSRTEGTLKLGGATVPWYSLPALLGQVEAQSEEQRPLILVLNVAGRTLAISIPQITGQKEIVLKGLGGHLRSVPGVSGAAVMGDGSIVPVLNIPDLIEAARRREHAHLMPLHLDIPQSFTVMIVDDSISIRRVMSRLVVANGWVPVEAKDGLDALELLNEIRPDCIALDIEMPRMNGFEFLVKFANTSYEKDIPIVMLTSRTSDKHREKAFQLGAKAFLNKPCKDEEFVATVLRLTGKHDAAQYKWNEREKVTS